jgi:hypothetical protein
VSAEMQSSSHNQGEAVASQGSNNNNSLKRKTHTLTPQGGRGGATPSGLAMANYGMLYPSGLATQGGVVPAMSMWTGGMPQSMFTMNQFHQNNTVQASQGMSALTNAAQASEAVQLTQQQQLAQLQAMQLNQSQFGWQGLSLQQLAQVSPSAQDNVSWVLCWWCSVCGV